MHLSMRWIIGNVLKCDKDTHPCALKCKIVILAAIPHYTSNIKCTREVIYLYIKCYTFFNFSTFMTFSIVNNMSHLGVCLGPQSVGGQSDTAPGEGWLCGGTSRRPGIIILAPDYTVCALGLWNQCLLQLIFQ